MNAPTNVYTEEEKGTFYFGLQGVMYKIPKYNLIIIMGDFNAKAGGSRENVEKVVGPFTRN